MFGNRRFSDRNHPEGVLSSLFDGASNFIGVVDDVSATGVRISNIPAGFNCSSKQCFSLINTLETDYKVVLIPRWTVTTNSGMYKTIGFKIYNPPPGWTQFVRKVTWGIQEQEVKYA